MLFRRLQAHQHCWTSRNASSTRIKALRNVAVEKAARRDGVTMGSMVGLACSERIGGFDRSSQDYYWEWAWLGRELRGRPHIISIVSAAPRRGLLPLGRQLAALRRFLPPRNCLMRYLFTQPPSRSDSSSILINHYARLSFKAMNKNRQCSYSAPDRRGRSIVSISKAARNELKLLNFIVLSP